MECSICGGTKYTDALKKYNQGKPEWCMPRKGTPGHTEILNIIAKPKRKLHQKRILDSASSKEAIVEEKKNMETPKRKLRSVKERENSKLMAMEDKDAPEIKVVNPKGEWYEHKYWMIDDGTTRELYEIDPVVRPGNKYFFKRMLTKKQKEKIGTHPRNFGFTVRITKKGLPHEADFPEDMRPI
jgi:hypothetical protein